MLDKSVSSSSSITTGEETETTSNDKKKEMNPWLRDKLEKADVLSTIEPFWTSSYSQVS